MSEKRKEYRILGRPHTIYKVVKSAENPYVMIDRRPIDNPALSFKAKGILTYLMARPDGWEVSVTDLVNHALDGEDSVRSGLKELKVAGHMKQTKMREKGRITGWLIEVFELPHAENRHVVNPDMTIPDMENPTQVISTLSKKDLNKNKREKKERLNDDDEEIQKKSSINERVQKSLAYWQDISGQTPSRTLRGVFKRFFTSADKFQAGRGESINGLNYIIERASLNNPNFPENYIFQCVNSLLENYEGSWSRANSDK